MTDPATSGASLSDAFTWRVRIEKAAETFAEWDVLPLEMRLDKAIKGAGFRELLVERDRLREALEVASDLLAQDGYDTDPDYRQEWQTIREALDA